MSDLFEIIPEAEIDDVWESGMGAGEYAARKYPIPEQKGPLRQYEKGMLCTSKNCGAPTNFKLEGAPYCMIHCLRLMNQMLLVTKEFAEERATP
jgi:hypothetical protein